MGQARRLRPHWHRRRMGIVWAGAVVAAGASIVKVWPHAWWWMIAVTATLAVLVPLLVSAWMDAQARGAETARLIRDHLQGTTGNSGDEPPVVSKAALKSRVHRAVVDIPYVRRDKEEEVRDLLKNGRPVLLVGSSMVGKTRMASEIVTEMFPTRRVIIPDNKGSLAILSAADIVMRDSVIWLDDIDRLIGVDGITDGALLRLADARNTILGTIRAEEYYRYIPTARDRPPQWDVISVFEHVLLDRDLSEAEQDRLNKTIGDPRIREQIRQVGLGEYVGAAKRIDEALALGAAVNPIGHSLIMGAADWRRIGISRPVPAAVLPDLAYPYLDARRRVELSDVRIYAAAIEWATEEINPTVSLLKPCEGNSFMVIDYALDIISRQAAPIPSENWEVVINNATLPELLTIGYANSKYQLPEAAETKWLNAIKPANTNTVPITTIDLGDLLNKHGDGEGAREAYRTAMDSGDAQVAASAATRLGDLLQEQGDGEGARQAYRLAIESRRRRFAFVNAVYTEPVALAEAFRRHWGEARRLMAGQLKGSPQFLALCDWVQAQHILDALTILERHSQPERLLVQLLTILDPALPPEFRGRVITSLGLVELTREATDEKMVGEATDLVDALYREGVLTLYDVTAGCDGHALLDDRWHRLGNAFESWEGLWPRSQPGEVELLRAARVALLRQVLVPEEEDVLAEQAEQCLSDAEAMSQQWFRDLGQERFDPELEPARYQLIVMMRGRAANEAVAARYADEHGRRQQKRERIDRISPPISIIAALLGPLFPFSGPIAVYFAIRSRRSGRYGPLSTIGLYFGLLVTVWFICVIVIEVKSL